MERNIDTGTDDRTHIDADTDVYVPPCSECGADLNRNVDAKWETVQDLNNRAEGRVEVPVAYCDDCGEIIDYGPDVTAALFKSAGKAIDVKRAQQIADDLAATGVLTDREAECYAFRRTVGISRQRTADELGITSSRVDNALRAAEDKIAGSRKLVDILHDLHGGDDQ